MGSVIRGVIIGIEATIRIKNNDFNREYIISNFSDFNFILYRILK